MDTEALYAQHVGPTMDATVAVKVMRYVLRDVPPDYDGKNAGQVYAPPGLPNDYDWPHRGAIGLDVPGVGRVFGYARYSTDDSAALQVVTYALNIWRHEASIRYNFGNDRRWSCLLDHAAHGPQFFSRGFTLAEAVCRAALKMAEQYGAPSNT